MAEHQAQCNCHCALHDHTRQQSLDQSEELRFPKKVAYYEVDVVQVFDVLNRIVALIKIQMLRDRFISPDSSYETLTHMIRLKMKDDANMEAYLAEMMYLLKRPNRVEYEFELVDPGTSSGSESDTGTASGTASGSGSGSATESNTRSRSRYGSGVRYNYGFGFPRGHGSRFSYGARYGSRYGPDPRYGPDSRYCSDSRYSYGARYASRHGTGSRYGSNSR
ncbi:uncharacterized protein LOC118267089 [Spodoptera frugiperda]|uniref:Uncharacterized protein LOC118267089 n=1 Tax=Spodoptera frugiperda TaxID=7108 RepID=A0A9R0EIG8_SPOFR|nr:uncharacterized protein LOC118267089 [Spodoptera frugiperda]